MRVGMTLNMETPVEAIFPYLDELDDVMLMSISPGWSGQELNPDVYPRLEAVRGEVDRRGLSTDVEIDGGVKIDNAPTSDRCGSHRAGRCFGDLPGARSAAAARELGGDRARRGAPRWPKPSWSSTTIRISRGSSR